MKRIVLVLGAAGLLTQGCATASSGSTPTSPCAQTASQRSHLEAAESVDKKVAETETMDDIDEIDEIDELEERFAESDRNELTDEDLAAATDPNAVPDPFSPTYGDTIELEAVIRIDTDKGGKAFQGVWLRLDDGSELLIAYRPDHTDYPLMVNRRVRVTGRPYTPGPMTQHILADHFEVTAIEVLTSTPAVQPPLDGSLELPAATDEPVDLTEHEWVGEVEELEATVEIGPLGPPGSKAAESIGVRLLVDDTTLLVAEAVSRYEPFVGKRVRVTGRKYEPSRFIARVGGTYFEVQRIEAIE